MLLGFLPGTRQKSDLGEADVMTAFGPVSPACQSLQVYAPLFGRAGGSFQDALRGRAGLRLHAKVSAGAQSLQQGILHGRAPVHWQAEVRVGPNWT